MTSTLTRRLVVILHADVVDSTALVQADETLAHTRIRDAFTRFSDTIGRYNGVAHEVRGDALIAEFARASDAITSSIAFQAANASHNDGLPDEIRPKLRVGIALGEAVVADNTVTGQGAIMAQRLEQLAAPGGIVIQGAVYETLPKRLPFDYEYMGEPKLKGFNEPVRAYAVALKSQAAVPEPEVQYQREPRRPGAPDKPSIAVLPFVNMSSDSEQEYFVDGITEDIITGLSRFHSLLVIARNSSFAFKNKNMDIKQIGLVLDVRYLLEGSIRTVGNRMRVTAQLIDSNSGIHIWAERYDRDLNDIFAVQDELVHAIVTTVGGKTEEAGKARAAKLRENEVRAYDWCLRAQSSQDRNTREAYTLAEQQLRQAIKLNPDLAQAHHQLSLVKFFEWMMGWAVDSERSFRDAFEAAQEALRRDQADSMVHAHLCMLYIYRREFELAGKRIESALRLNANDAKALGIYGFYLSAIGEPSRAIEQFAQLAQLNPVEPGWITRVRGVAYLTAERYEDAIATFSSIESPLNIVRGWLAASQGLAGRVDEARSMLDEFLSVAEKEMSAFPGRRLSQWKTAWRGIQYKNPADSDRFFEGLRLAGLEDGRQSS